MNNKNMLVFVLAIVSVFALMSVVSATNTTNYYSVDVEVNDFVVSENGVNAVQILAGETIKIEVELTAGVTDESVTVEAELKAGKEKVRDISSSFRISNGSERRFILSLEVPFELKDELEDNAILTIEIDGKKYSEDFEYTLLVERVDYNAVIKSVTVDNSVEAGDTFSVDVVLKNLGYLDLDDVFVTASISALNLEKTSYFGDMVSMEDDCAWCDDDDKDSASGRLTLKVPYTAEARIYTLEVEVTNDDTTTSKVFQIVIKNDFSNNVIVSSYKKTVASGEDATYELLIVNPTDKVKVYRVVSDSEDLSVSVENSLIAVPAGSSKNVVVTASANAEGEYNFNVNIFSGEELASITTLSLTTEGRAVADLTVVLTVILAIIFIVLLVVLIVLIGKKPAKTAEEFGESYY